MKAISRRASNREKVTFRLQETTLIPPLSLLFGSAAMAPFACGAISAWVLNGSSSIAVVGWTIVWGQAVLFFLAGVRRGLSFRTPGGANKAQMATMLWLFLLALASSIMPWQLVSLGILLLGYASIVLLDPVAAEHHEVPLFFARLRPVQMLVPVVSLAAMMLRLALLL